MTDYFLKEGGLTPGNAVVGMITLEDGRYLCQLRDKIPGIFYPDHWGLFGDAVETGESPEEGLERELMEELALKVDYSKYVTEFTFDFSFRGLGKIWRRYYRVSIETHQLGRLRLGEGREFRVLSAQELLAQHRVVPYDAFAVWMNETHKVSIQS